MLKFSKRYIKGVSAALCVALAAAGCASYGQSAGLGAATGAGLGAIIGHQSGHAGEGAVIGALLGGATGLIVHDIRVRAEQRRTAQETAVIHQYQPAQGQKIYAESATCSPSVAQRGQDLEAQMEYAVLGSPAGGTPVKETRILRKDGQDVATLDDETYTRSDGTWVSTVTFAVPKNAEPGKYTIVQTVSIPERDTISKNVDFTVQ